MIVSSRKMSLLRKVKKKRGGNGKGWIRIILLSPNLSKCTFLFNVSENMILYLAHSMFCFLVYSRKELLLYEEDSNYRVYMNAQSRQSNLGH